MIDWAARIALHQPLWLLLLPLPWLALRPARPARGRLARFADPHLLRWLIVAPARKQTWVTRLAWLLTIVALSGPYLETADGSRHGRGLDLAIVIDISPSMLAADLDPDRLQRVKLEVRDLIARLHDDRTALIAYSAYAYTLLPLTHDHALLRHYAESLAPDLTRRRGSNLVQALELAAQALEGESRRGRGIVLLTDGETHDPDAVRAAADRLRSRNLPVYALGVGTPAGAPVPAAAGGYLRQDGEVVISRPDRSLLQELAERTGGAYADARLDDRDWARLFEGLDALPRDRRAVERSGQALALYPWLFAAALGLLLWNMLRNTVGRRPSAAAPAMILAGIMIFPGDGAAAPWREQAAHEALVEGRNDEAARLYGELHSFTGWLGRGAAAYRSGRWAAALDAFAAAEGQAAGPARRADAAYNQGNALTRLGRFDEAVESFERALDLNPGHKAAALNLGLVRRARLQRPDPADQGPRRPQDRSSARGKDKATGTLADSARGDGDPGRRSTALQQAIRRWRKSDAARDPDAAARPREASAEVLRQRFMMQDARHPLGPEPNPW